MRKSLVMLLASLTLALGLCPAFAFAANDAEGGGLAPQAAGETHTITIVDANGPGSGSETQEAQYGAMLSLTRATGVNAAFTGWSVDGTVISTTSPYSYEVTKDATVTANWSTAYLTVTFKRVDKSGDAYTVNASYTDTQLVAEGGTPDLTAVKSDSGYTGTEWYTDQQLKTKYDGSALSADLTLYAEFEPGTFTISYDANGGTGEMASQSLVSGSYKQLETNIGKVYWKTIDAYATNQTTNQAADGRVPESTTYDADTMTYSETQWPVIMNVRDRVNVKANEFVWADHTFQGWNTLARPAAATASQTAKAVDDLITSENLDENITLYAQWQAVWTVTLDTNKHGTVTQNKLTVNKPAQLTDESAYTMDATQGALKGVTANDIIPSATGYVFTGWYEEANCKTQVIKADGSLADNYTKEFKENVTLYAGWEANSYTVKFDAGKDKDNQNIELNEADQTVKYGAYVKEPTPYKKNATTHAEITEDGKKVEANPGYTVKWCTDSQFKNAFDFSKPLNTTEANASTITLYAKWTAIKYSVKLDANATDATGEIKAISAEYDKAFDIPKCSFKRDGFEFIGWAKKADAIVADFTPASDGKVAMSGANTQLTTKADDVVTLYAVWSPVSSYKVAYDANGGTFVTKENSKHEATETATVLNQEIAVKATNATLLVPTNVRLERTGYSLKVDATYDYLSIWNTLQKPTTAALGTEYKAKAEDDTDASHTTDGSHYNNQVAQSGQVAMTIYAQWTPNKYDVLYKSDATDSAKTATETIEYDGYVWQNNAATESTAITLKTAKELQEAAADSDKSAWAPTGKKFAGWKVADKDTKYAAGDTISNTALNDENTTENASGNRQLVLVAQWEDAVYNVFFDSNGGTLKSGTDEVTGKEYANPTADAISYANTAKKITVPGNIYEKSGYTQNGWNTAADGTGANNFAASTQAAKVELDYAQLARIGKDITLYPKWEPAHVDGKYTAEFYNEDGTELLETHVVTNGTAPAITGAAPTKASDDKGDYTFQGWAQKDKDGKIGTTALDFTKADVVANFGIDETSTSDPKSTVDVEKFYAVFQLTPKVFTVTFDGNGVAGAKVPDAEKVPYDQTVDGTKWSQAKATADGYDFEGWYEDAACTKAFAASTPITKDLTLYAKFTPNTATKEAARTTAAAAQTLIGAAVVADDASKVATDKQWMTEAQKKALEDAVAAIANAGDNITMQQINALNDAYNAVKDQKGSDATQAAATDEEKKAADDAIAKTEAILADENLSADEKKALEDALDAYAKADPKTQADVNAVVAAVEKAEKAIDDAKKATDEAVKQAEADKKAYDDAQADLVKANETAAASKAAAEEAAKTPGDAAVKAAEQAEKDAKAAQAAAEAVQAAAEKAAASAEAAGDADGAADLKSKAEAAKTAAENAAQATKEATAAKDNADYEAAQKAADEAKAAADKAKTAADEAAKTPGDAAVKAAQDAQAAAEKAQAAAEAAQKAAETAAASAKAAGNETAAADLTKKAEAAKTAADNAKTAAETAKKATDAAKTAADKAKAKAKKANPMKAKAKAVKAKAKKKTTIKKAKAFSVTKAQGKVTFKKTKGNKKITVSKAGKVTVKKGLKKGKTYKVKVKVTAAGNANYKSATKTVTLKVKVK